MGDLAGGCESGRSSTFLEPCSPPGSFSNSPRVSSCKVNNSGVIFFDKPNYSRFDVQMINRGEQHELSFVGSVLQVSNIPIIIKVDSKLYCKSHCHLTFKIPPILFLLAPKVLLEDL